jgi:iron complex outermembrane recepter protein
VRSVSWAAFAAAGILGIDNAHAQRFNVPPGRLGEVAAALGEQGGATITVTDPDLAARRSPGVKGSFRLRAALDRALRGTGTEAMFYDRNTVRIVRKREPIRTPRKPQPPAAPPIAPDPPPEIVVTASKQHIPIDSYPGSVKLVALDPGWVAGNAAGGTAAITKLLPSVGSTNLGSARNKLFIRGIADSSFNGPTQATVGQYLGDVRLNYNAPDPNLNLYDMKRIEVLVGPQGTLYGASSLGGIIRLVPNEPDTHTLSTTVSAGISGTRFGGVGGDAAAMLNLPIADDRVAVRFVVFATREAGYIDAPARKRRNINNTTSYGQRLAGRVEDLWGFSVDFGTATHNTSTRDGQYTRRGDPPLTRDLSHCATVAGAGRAGFDHVGRPPRPADRLRCDGP